MIILLAIQRRKPQFHRLHFTKKPSRRF